MTIEARCHCGMNVFLIDGDLPPELTRCTCSICAARGALYAYFEPGQMTVVKGDADAVYRWNTNQVAHHFCAHCGCTTYSDSPAFKLDGTWDGKTRRIGANARLFKDFDAATAPVKVIDGRHLW